VASRQKPVTRADSSVLPANSRRRDSAKACAWRGRCQVRGYLLRRGDVVRRRAHQPDCGVVNGRANQAVEPAMCDHNGIVREDDVVPWPRAGLVTTAEKPLFTALRNKRHVPVGAIPNFF